MKFSRSAMSAWFYALSYAWSGSAFMAHAGLWTVFLLATAGD